VANELQTKHHTKALSVKSGFRMNGGGASGGTLASILALFELPKKELMELSDPYLLNPNQSRENLKGKGRKEERDQRFPRDDKDFGVTMPFVMAAINTRVVRRSSALYNENTEADSPYSSNFTYNETQKVKSKLLGVVLTLFIGFFFVLCAIPFVRRFLAAYVLPKPGQGPSEERRKKASFQVDVVGYGEDKTKVVARMTGGDPGYGDTAKMISEAALTLALDSDKLPPFAGILTPATGCGLPLITRLQAIAGIKLGIHST